MKRLAAWLYVNHGHRLPLWVLDRLYAYMERNQ